MSWPTTGHSLNMIPAAVIVQDCDLWLISMLTVCWKRSAGTGWRSWWWRGRWGRPRCRSLTWRGRSGRRAMRDVQSTNISFPTECLPMLACSTCYSGIHVNIVVICHNIFHHSPWQVRLDTEAGRKETAVSSIPGQEVRPASFFELHWLHGGGDDQVSSWCWSIAHVWLLLLSTIIDQWEWWSHWHTRGSRSRV